MQPWGTPHRSPYIVWARLFLKTYTNKKLHSILMRHIHAYKLAATYKMTLMYFLINIHINNQSTPYKVNGVAVKTQKPCICSTTSSVLSMSRGCAVTAAQILFTEAPLITSQHGILLEGDKNGRRQQTNRALKRRHRLTKDNSCASLCASYSQTASTIFLNLFMTRGV